MREHPLLLGSLLALTGATFLGACGTSDPVGSVADASPVTSDADASPIDPDAGAPRYLPLAVGNVWTYRITDPATGASAEKTSTVEAEEDVGGSKAGVIAFRLRTDRLDGSTTSWQESVGTRVVRHREVARDLSGVVVSEETFVPAKLRLDESPDRLVAGATYSDTYTEISLDPATGQMTQVVKTERWTVDAVDESVTVPAGTFRCLRVRRAGAQAGQADKTWFFAPGVGKVKELGGQTEELISSSLLP